MLSYFGMHLPCTSRAGMVIHVMARGCCIFAIVVFDTSVAGVHNVSVTAEKYCFCTVL